MYRTVVASLLVFLASTAIADAEMVEVFPSLSVTKHTYNAPLNEQPFYGFAPKSELMLAADRKFIASVEHNTGREVGAEQFETMGWNAVREGDFATAAKRFNQSWLLSPGRSASVHGLAVVASGRFGDTDFAVELATKAAGLKDPLPSLPGDLGGLLVRAGKPDLAIPVLEKATAAFPTWINPQLNLATAWFETGHIRETCRYLTEVERMLEERPKARSATIENIYQPLREKAHCDSTRDM